jgi:hypothetical protein
MSGVSSYILSIAGVILISVIIELVMCEGEMNKYIKSIFAFFTIAVIVSPLPNILSSESVSSIFDINDYELQQGYIDSLNKTKAEVLSSEIELLLKNEGYENILINITFDTDNIHKVNVNLLNIKVTDKAEYNDIVQIQEYISKVLKDKFNIDGGRIVYEI